MSIKILVVTSIFLVPVWSCAEFLGTGTYGGTSADNGTADDADTGSGDNADTGSGNNTDTGSGDNTDTGSGDNTDTGSGDNTDPGSGDNTDTGSGDNTDTGSGDNTDTGSNNHTGGGLLPVHWHESKGFGTDTQGGLTGEVCRVTNLRSSGGGSLKDCVSGSNKLVVFEVGGVIDLDGGSIAIGGSNITVAGQTAPSPGITLLRGNFSANGSDIVVSHIAIQLGDGVSGYPDTSNIRGDNVVFDHVSAWWGMDETLSIHGVKDVTLFKCIIAEGLQFTGHEDGEHSKGSLINHNPKNLGMIGTLYAHNALRNPRVDGGEIFLANHVVYNWGPGWDHKGPLVYSDDELGDCPQCFNKVVSIRSGCKATLVNSVALQGPESLAKYFLAGHNGSANGYLDSNIIIDTQGNPLQGVDTGEIKVLDSPPLWPDGYVPMPAEEALYEVLRTAGPRPGDRDFHHDRLIRSVADGNGEIVDSQKEVNGYPNYTETSRPISSIPDEAEARQAWLDELEDQIAVDRDLDLSRLYGLVGSAASDKLK
jgi:hypothetical protein